MGHESEDAGLSKYIERVRRIPLLDRETEHEVAVRAAAGDADARELLVTSNLRFVVSVAVQHRRPGLRLADLIAEGNVGLLIAAKKFDPSRGTRFVSYAGYWIRALVLDLVVRASSLVGSGSGPMRSKIFFRLRRERARLAQVTEDVSERNALLAAKFETTEAKMAQMLGHLDARIVSLDAPVAAESGVSLLDTLEGDRPDAESALAEGQITHIAEGRLKTALLKLDPRERYIVEQRFMQDEAASLADIGRTLGVSRERARQLEVRAKSAVRSTPSTVSSSDARSTPAPRSA